MRDSRRRAALALAAAIAAGACTSNPAPKGWLAPAAKSLADPYGAWITVTPHGDVAPLSGEFLAVDGDSIFVLVRDGGVRSIATDDASRAQIAYYDAAYGGLALWTFLGAVSTPSHGFLLVFSFPGWVLAGSAITGAQSKAPLIDMFEADSWGTVRMYARYPTGLPPGLPRTIPAKRWEEPYVPENALWR